MYFVLTTHPSFISVCLFIRTTLFLVRFLSAGFLPLVLEIRRYQLSMAVCCEKMAKMNRQAVFLGFEDELMNEENSFLVSYGTNKIGGKPDFPKNVNIDNPPCPLCQLSRPLALQIYAPIENDIYHRMLYLFACINPSCWNRKESWTCYRVQIQKDPSLLETAKPTTNCMDWGLDADNWGEDDNSNFNEENGNLVGAAKVSDDEDESCSFDDSISVGMGNLTVDDRNANTGGLPEAQGGAVGRLHSPSATAEIEGNEGEVICIDTPTFPQNDIIALLKETAPLPQELSHQTQTDNSVQFRSYFMMVHDETMLYKVHDEHTLELLESYEMNTEDEFSAAYNANLEMAVAAGSRDKDNPTLERYEEGVPIHGDKMFHQFISRIQLNPGQLLRYSRGNTEPLLLYPLVPREIPRSCRHCQGPMVFELQVLPTLISKLTLTSDVSAVPRLDYGNVLLFTCKKSCWSTDLAYRQEEFIVQREV